MNRFGSTMDESERAIDRDLERFFAPRRCDADAFAAGVARRIAAAPADATHHAGQSGGGRHASSVDATRVRPATPPRWPRRAAAWLPIEAATLLGAGGKALPFALALPALILASCALTLVGGFRSLRRDGTRARTQPSSEASGGKPVVEPGATALILLQIGPLPVMVASLWFGGERALDVWLFLIVVSMVALILLVRRAAQAGLMDRPRVAQLCVGLLSLQLIAFVQFPWRSSGVGVDWILGPAGPVWPLIAGSWICASATSGLARRIGHAVVIALFAGLWLAIAPPTSISPLVRASATGDDLRELARRVDVDPDELRGWRELQATVESLKRIGGPLPDLSAASRRLREFIAGGARPHPVVLTAAVNCGMLSREDLCRLAEEPVTRATFAQWKRAQATQGWSDSDDYLFPLLLAVDPPDAQARDAWLRRVEANWPASDAPRALEAADRCVRAWTWLQATDRIEAHRASLAEILTRHWIGEPTSTPHATLGGFSPDPDHLATSLADATHRGVRLLAWSAVPPGIDVDELRAHLLRESQAPLSWFRDVPIEWRALERAALAELEATVDRAPAGVLATIVRERLLLGSLALLCLCLFAIASSPPGAEEALRRARRRGA